MKALLIYFSQTGNTLRVAEKIRDGIRESGHACDTVRLVDCTSREFSAYDLIGIGCPTFFYREPRNVAAFIRSLEQVDGMHCFLFCTHGSIMGNTFYFLAEELKKKRFVVFATFDAYGDSSLQFYPQPMHTAHHPDEKELRQASDFGRNVCRVSQEIRDSHHTFVPEFTLIEDTWWAQAAQALSPDMLRSISPELTIDQDTCTQCRTCQDSCPVDAIDVEATPPEIQKDGCMFCWFCEKVCPSGAISGDWTRITELTRPSLRKYVDELQEAEAAGRFRPYVDYRRIV